jgi:Aldo/keto reductase family
LCSLCHQLVADHYGPAEIVFVSFGHISPFPITPLQKTHTLFQQGQFQEHLPPRTVLGGTKWCVFKHAEISRATVETAVRERMTRMRTRQLDFLQVRTPKSIPFWGSFLVSHIPTQFYWQDYSNKGYMTALRYLQDMQRDGHINALGLVNFDAVRTDEICTQLGPGAIVSNQVQASLSKTFMLPGSRACPTFGERPSRKKKTFLMFILPFTVLAD